MEYKELTTKEQLDKLYEGWNLTFEGVELTDGNFDFLKGWLNDNGAVKKELDFVYVIKGATMNSVYGLTGDNMYPDDLNIVAIDNEHIDTNKIAIKRFALGGRWFTDIVDNNARREERNDVED